MKKVMVLMAVTALAASAWAQGPGVMKAEGPRGSGAPGMCPMRDARGPGGLGGGLMFLVQHPALAEKVGLTQDEVKKLRDLAFQHAEEMIQLRAAAEKARLELEQAKAADTPDAAAVEKAIDKVHAAEAQIDKAQYRHRQAVRSIISEERLQDLWESARALREERRAKRSAERERRAHFGKRGHGMRFPMALPADDDDDDEGEGDDEAED